jgi:predicted DNA-binding protein YlxM (UPF0122 family)
LRVCTICAHSQRPAIDAALVAGGSFRDIAGRFGLSRSAVHRHREHIPAALTQAKQAQEVAQASTLLGRIEALIADCRTISQKAQRARQWPAAVSALREVRSCLELLGQLSGELQKEVTVNMNVSRRALFDRMTRGEMELYAREGVKPEWFRREENGNGKLQ